MSLAGVEDGARILSVARGPLSGAANAETCITAAMKEYSSVRLTY
jgi:hypothetical protein